jgi:hypothetical protein
MRLPIGRPFFLVCGVAMAACAGPAGEPAGPAPSAAARELPAEAIPAREMVRAVAQRGLADWLGAIPRSHVASYGFRDEAERAGATVGEPVALHDLLPDQADPSIDDPNAFVEAAPSQYLVPVLVGGQARVFLRLRIRGGGAEITGLGAAEEAAEWAIARVRWPEEGGFHLRFARRPGGPGFLLVDTLDGTRFVPMPSAARVFHLSRPPMAEVDLSNLPPARVVMDRVRSARGRGLPVRGQP